MEGRAEGRVGRRAGLVWAVHLSVLLLVVLWTLPTAGLFVTSLRDRDQIAVSGWWTALATSSQSLVFRAPAGDGEVEEAGRFVLRGTVLDGGAGRVTAFGTSSRAPAAFRPGETAELGDGVRLTVAADGGYELFRPAKPQGQSRPADIRTAETPPRFTLANYAGVLGAEPVSGGRFSTSMTVTMPATVIPILIAAFAAYALAWMEFPGRALLIAAVVGLLVVPLQTGADPASEAFTTGWVRPSVLIPRPISASGLPIPASACRWRSISCATTWSVCRARSSKARASTAPIDFEIFPASCCRCRSRRWPAFAIFQFLWTWNDLLVALVFLGTGDDRLVLTGRLREPSRLARR